MRDEGTGTSILLETERLFLREMDMDDARMMAKCLWGECRGVESEITRCPDMELAGTATGPIIAQSNTNYTTAQVRNIILSTSEPTSSDGSNGDIWIVYEV